jgi:polyisoprenoid-binding protein YceI
MSSRQSSKLLFTVKHPSDEASSGTFPDFVVWVLGMRANPLNAVFSVSIDVRSLHSYSRRNERRLKGSTCLDVRKHSTITFTSFQLRKSGLNMYRLMGMLTLRGISKYQHFDLVRRDPQPKGNDDFLWSRFTVHAVIKGSEFAAPSDSGYRHADYTIYLDADIDLDRWDKRDLSVFDILEVSGEPSRCSRKQA